tara:strand:+ start:417 stop:590 length:174 start_codon:yes stop_codon:yes gene_type:complete
MYNSEVLKPITTQYTHGVDKLIFSLGAMIVAPLVSSLLRLGLLVGWHLAIKKFSIKV